MVTCVRLGPMCCIWLMYLLHLLWMKHAVLWRFSLSLVFSVCSSGSAFCSPSPSACSELCPLLDEFVDLFVPRQLSCGSDHRVVVPVDASWLCVYDLALALWRCFFFVLGRKIVRCVSMYCSVFSVLTLSLCLSGKMLSPSWCVCLVLVVLP